MRNIFEQAVEAAIHSMPGLQGRDQRLKEWQSNAYSLGHADARALSVRLLDGKQVRWQVFIVVTFGGLWLLLFCCCCVLCAYFC